MSEEIFSTDIPDLQSFIKELDLFDENVNRALRTSMHEAGNMICLAQRRLVKSQRLAAAITTGRVYTTKKGSLNISVGYQPEAFKTDGDGFNPGVVGMVTEFGRPGTSAGRTGEKMKQKRKRIPNKKTAKRKDWEKAVPTEVKIDKGTIQPRPHIRLGFDSTKEAAAQKLIDTYNTEIDKLGD